MMRRQQQPQQQQPLQRRTAAAAAKKKKADGDEMAMTWHAPWWVVGAGTGTAAASGLFIVAANAFLRTPSSSASAASLLVPPETLPPHVAKPEEIPLIRFRDFCREHNAELSAEWKRLAEAQLQSVDASDTEQTQYLTSLKAELPVQFTHPSATYEIPKDLATAKRMLKSLFDDALNRWKATIPDEPATGYLRAAANGLLGRFNPFF